MVKQLLELFPEKEIPELAAAIKENNFVIEAVINSILAPKPVKRVIPPELQKPEPVATPIKSVPKFVKEAKRIKDVVPDASNTQILSLLEQFKGDEEKVILYLLENGASASPPKADVPSNPIETQAGFGSGSGSSSEEWIAAGSSGDESNEWEDGDFELEEGWDEIEEEYAWDADPELKLFFGHLQPQKPKDDRPDMITQLHQELADQEFAAELQKKEEREAAARDRKAEAHKQVAEQCQVSPQAKAREAKRYRVTESGKHGGRVPGGPTQFVEPDAALAGFLEYVQEAEFRQLTTPVQEVVESLLTTPVIFQFQQLRYRKMPLLQSLKNRQAAAARSTPPAPQNLDPNFFDVSNAPPLAEPNHKAVSTDSEASFKSELASLQTLFPDRVTLGNCYPRRLTIRLNERKNTKSPLHLLLFVEFWIHFDNVPKFFVRSSLVKSVVDKAVLSKLGEFLNQKARIFHAQGQPVIPSVVVAAELWLNLSQDVTDAIATHEGEATAHFEKYGKPFGESLKNLFAANVTYLRVPELSSERTGILAKMGAAAPQVPLSELTQLMVHFNWNPVSAKKALAKHIEQGTLETLWKDAKINKQNEEAGWVAQLPTLTDREYDCPCCLDTYPVNQMISLKCRHLYCVDCMSQIVELKVTEGGGNTIIVCPGFECCQRFDEVTIGALVDPTVFAQYNGHLANAFVSECPTVRWCPSGKCDVATRLNGQQNKGQILCECGHLWCWACRQEGHYPASCDHQKWWTEVYTRDEGKLVFQSLDEAETVKWLLNYTQDCPKCSSPIEKNGGCNHMSCKKCKYDYCWVCKDPWTGSHYNCSSPSDASHERADEIAKRIDLNLTFRQLYLVHLKAKKITDHEHMEDTVKLCQSLLNLPTTTIEDIETIFLMLEVVVVTRHVLLKLCIFGKYLQEHKMAGSNPLKKELRRIGSQLSFVMSCLETNVKLYQRQVLLDSMIGMKSCFQQFMLTFHGILKAHKVGK